MARPPSDICPMAHLNLGTLLASRGRIQEAEEVLIRCSQLDGSAVKDPRTHESTRVSSLVHLGRIYADRGDHAKAVQVYSQAVAIKPKDYQPQREGIAIELRRLDRSADENTSRQRSNTSYMDTLE
ncbi:unnamed protein product [Nezara viridula]|uniref:Uncharacterized protein n=1 Tax=Nezara viridula TaxID=85310 RepID=A0A9P0HKP6_NEZVI|nr:unnamed protein product [Nezara viridula]